MKYDNEFDCPNGHKFRANAKLHARCPDCGKMAKRDYAKMPIPSASDAEGSAPLLPSASSSEISGVQLIKRGKPKASLMATKRTTPPKGPDGKFLKAVTAIKKPVTRKKSTVSVRATNKISHIKPTPKSTALVKKRTVSSIKVGPKVTGKPPRTAIARHIDGSNKRKSYADEVMENYGFRR